MRAGQHRRHQLKKWLVSGLAGLVWCLGLAGVVRADTLEETVTVTLDYLGRTGETVHTSILWRIVDDHSDSADATITAIGNYQRILRALQARYPEITTLALAPIAYRHQDNLSEAISEVASVSELTSTIQDHSNVSRTAAQIVASVDVANRELALDDAGMIASETDFFAGELGIGSAGAEILAALDVVGELNYATRNTAGDYVDDSLEVVKEIYKTMISSKPLSSQVANELVASQNILSAPNYTADARSVQKIATLVSEQTTVSDQASLQALVASQLGSIAGLSESASAYENVATQIANQVASQVGGSDSTYENLHSQVSQHYGSDDLSRLGSETVTDAIVKNSSLSSSNAWIAVTSALSSKISQSRSAGSAGSSGQSGGTGGGTTSGGGGGVTTAGTGSPAPGGAGTAGDTNPDNAGTNNQDGDDTASPTPQPYVKSAAQGAFARALLGKLGNNQSGDSARSAKIKVITKNILLEGYETYHIHRTDRVYPYTNAIHAANDVDFSQASVPLLRNDNYKPERLNSAETYYGYGASKARNPDSDIIIESGWVTKTTQPVQCMLKASNLIYMVRVCDVAQMELCDNLYHDASNEAKILGTQIKIEDLSRAVTAMVLEGGSGEMTNKVLQAFADGDSSDLDIKDQLLQKLGVDGDDVTKRLKAMSQDKNMDPIFQNRTPVCESIYGVYSGAGTQEELKKVTQGRSPQDAAKIYLQWAINKLDIYLPTQYKTAYLVQVNRICPVRTQGICTLPIYKYATSPFGPCVNDITPDQVRVYPFKVPDLFVNKNFCLTDDDKYPGLSGDNVECQLSSRYKYAEMIQEYYDPALSEKNFLEPVELVQSYRDKMDQKRRTYAQKASEECTANSITTIRRRLEADTQCKNQRTASGKFIDCENCKGDDSGLITKASLVKMINAAIKENTMYNITNPNGNSPGTDNVTDGLKSKDVAANAYNPLEGKITNNLYFNDFCLYMGLIPFYAYSSIDYYVVEPFSDEVQAIEDGVVSELFYPDDYQKFLKADSRQNRKIQMSGIQNLLNDNIPLWLPAGGPIGNVFLQQETLYNTDLKLYQNFKNCHSVPSYFESRCSKEDSEPGSNGGSGDKSNSSETGSD